MSGHSKWHKVKHQKARNDPQKGKEFSRLSMQIQVAARESGPDPDQNPSLRKAMDEAKAGNMPKENIQKAINKGAGIGLEGGLEVVKLEGYGPGGVALMLEAETDNRNRTLSEIRFVFKQYGASVGEPGSAAYVFGDDPNEPQFRTQIADPKAKNQFENLIEALEEHVDVTEVWHNLG